jgi:hypothetical protein
MPDITMCKDHDCNLKESCYRYASKPDIYQSYFMSSPKDEDGECRYYWEHIIEKIVKPKIDKKKL